MSHQLQSVVIYGHRRMGKTSILLNITNRLGAGVKVAYVNLLLLGDTPQGVGEVLMAISDEISVAVNLPPPPDENLLNLPYRTFERYLKQVETQLECRLIIALDEFEKIAELIETGKISPDFMGFLRGLVQMSTKIAFAFAGLHTLEEMTRLLSTLFRQRYPYPRRLPKSCSYSSNLSQSRSRLSPRLHPRIIRSNLRFNCWTTLSSSVSWFPISSPLQRPSF
ncbi:regulatory protein IclR [Microseira wollei NIES-4236]|uniref:Regulatory protein IclR n=1 Tax=Microseira wollei NIES-4236 TaxID=2530354 RepID=A0AAV3X4D2_9CYAN|nr:AAA family ATPase [Microseira wollei]GET35441.1 regulatory protein IclR [Microseira wollei NIES-4236]